ncbi:hypothetical protein [Amycolatopsis sp. NPDC049868]|uniref:hypothetical protein n=1 Tax=Amycolatopsis sp. NPDC049868 TaxID=3363934 RepID=UPI0037A86CEF
MTGTSGTRLFRAENLRRYRANPSSRTRHRAFVDVGVRWWPAMVAAAVVVLAVLAVVVIRVDRTATVTIMGRHSDVLLVLPPQTADLTSGSLEARVGNGWVPVTREPAAVTGPAGYRLLALRVATANIGVGPTADEGLPGQLVLRTGTTALASVLVKAAFP